MKRPAPRTATTRHVTQINRTAILDVLREHGPLSRRDIQQRTGLGSATIERLCAALMEEGAVEAAGQVRQSVGRPSTLLRFASSARAIMAVDVTEYTARGRLVDLGGSTLHEESHTFALEGQDAGAARIDGLLALVDRLTSPETGVTAPIVAVGITVPGIVHEGVVTKAVELDWQEVPLADIVSARSGLPILVENDANATAYGEWHSGALANANSAVALVLGARLGAGIINEARLHRGHRSAAGEIGFLLTSSASFSRYFTEQGDVDSTLAAQVLPFAAREGLHGKRIGPAFRAMMACCRTGDSEAEQARDEFFDSIALALVATSVVLSPQVIVLAGAFAQYSEESAEQLTRRLVGRIPWVPRIAVSDLGFDAAITGVSALTIEHARSATYLA
ncbi:ROK family protein [Streptomyces sp. NPDC002144]|uniref:ROK family transcriptional regulator n=1 Tax=Streptomyces sp. NPDC006668 TaxID=3156903 RepID=UPI0010558299